jgi:transposase InsO family protein
VYGRKKMTALIRRTSIPDVSRGAVDRAMRLLGLSGVTRAKAIRTTIPAKDGIRAGDLLNRDFTAPRPDHTWVMGFTYVRSWAGWVDDRVHPRRLLAMHRGLARADHQAHRACDDPAADGAVGTEGVRSFV